MRKTTSKKTTPTAPTTELRELILWARENGIVLSEVQLGDVRVVLSDIRLASSGVSLTSDDERATQNLYRQFGGDALAEVVKEDDIYDDE